jgi:hypothetical protein
MNYELTIWHLEGDQRYHVRYNGKIIAGFTNEDDAKYFLNYKLGNVDKK